eukprot:1152593-Pelagomonas_calceolata.AAC.2
MLPAIPTLPVPLLSSAAASAAMVMALLLCCLWLLLLVLASLCKVAAAHIHSLIAEQQRHCRIACMCAEAK